VVGLRGHLRLLMWRLLLLLLWRLLLLVVHGVGSPTPAANELWRRASRPLRKVGVAP
jgi:hypothetical protein